MKKIFVAVMAMAAFAACSNEEQIATPKGPAIAFGDAFVDNTTKAIYEVANDIKGFTVWGNVKGKELSDIVALYGTDGAAVTRGSKGIGEAWSCTETRYWTPSCEYNFVAIANGSVAVIDGQEAVENGIPTKIAYSVNTTEPADLIYGAATAETSDANVVTGSVVNSNVVAFTMKHLLSRVKLSFKNGDDTTDDAYTYTITGVTVKTWEDGVYTISSETWAQSGSDVATITYASNVGPIAEQATASVSDFLVIPSSTVSVAFTYDLKLNGTKIYGGTVEGTFGGIVNEVPVLEVGHAYNVVAELKQNNEIEFTVTGLDTFDEGGNLNM